MEIASVPPPAVALQNAAPGKKAGDSAVRKADTVAGEVRYLNPRIQFDRDSGSVIIQYRDTKTGEVREEFPPKLAADSYSKRAQANDSAARSPTSLASEAADRARPSSAPSDSQGGSASAAAIATPVRAIA
jgi:hypothetical protein